MKNLMFLLFVLGIVSCSNSSEESNNAADSSPKVKLRNTIDESSPKVKDDVIGGNSQYFKQDDSVWIHTEIGETLTYTKAEFTEIIDNHPEFTSEITMNPDVLYLNGKDKDRFQSEVGRDEYYALYAYFLKGQNGVGQFIETRNKLIEIYNLINDLYSQFQYGGTYFGHQRWRILGYVEYSIYSYPKSKKEYEKTYNIEKQKSLYIQSLRQLVKDENEIDFNTLGEDKTRRINEQMDIVSRLDSLITDIYYLRLAQEFQHTHYGYV